MPMMIVFDKLSYIPGSVVSGHVVIVKRAPEKVKGLTMRFIGRSSKLLKSDLDTVAIKNYKKEVYFDEKIDVFGHDGTNTLLKIGETLFPFTFNLPAGLPSSFVWSSGNILYFVEAKLTRSSWKDDKRINTRMQIEGIFDLNLDPLSLLPAEIKRHKYVQHLLSKSGPFGFTFRISRSGFVRGHTIPFSVEIKNLSKIDSKKLKISLLQEVIQEGKESTRVVEQLKGSSVPSGEIQTWESRLKIPSEIPPTNLGNILHFPVLLSVQYSLHIELSLKSATVDPLCAKIPVTIGTISLLRNRDRHRLQQLQMLQGTLLHSHPHPHPHEQSLSSLPPNPFAHDHDCPLSQVILPVSSTPSQFNPNSVIHSSIIVSQGQDGRSRSLTPSHIFMNPLNGPRIDYYLGPENSAFRIQRPAYARRARHHREIRESPPPSYDEVVSSQQNTRLILSGIKKKNEDNNRNRDEGESSNPAQDCSDDPQPEPDAENRPCDILPGPSKDKSQISQSPVGNQEEIEKEEDEEVKKLFSSNNSKAQNSETQSLDSSLLLLCS